MNNVNNKPLQVCCAIIESDGKILIAQRSEKMNLALKWEFPGGKIEKGETAENCIVREIKEELGIDIKVKDRLKENVHDYGSRVIELIPFVCCVNGGKIKVLEHKNIIWDKAEKLNDLDFAGADIPIYNEYLGYIRGEKANEIDGSISNKTLKH